MTDSYPFELIEILSEKNSSLPNYKEKYGEKCAKMMEELIEVFRGSKIAMTMNQIKDNFKDNGNSLEIAIKYMEYENLIKATNIGEIRKLTKLPRIRYREKPKERIFYIDKKQLENYVKQSPYFSPQNWERLII